MLPWKVAAGARLTLGAPCLADARLCSVLPIVSVMTRALPLPEGRARAEHRGYLLYQYATRTSLEMLVWTNRNVAGSANIFCGFAFKILETRRMGNDRMRSRNCHVARPMQVA